MAAIALFCACGSGRGQSECIAVWNADDNAARRADVAGRFSVADISEWMAEPAGGEGAARGCGYLFHDDKRYVSFSWERTPERRWGVPPKQRGPWSAQQQANVRDDARVRPDGSVERR